MTLPTAHRSLRDEQCMAVYESNWQHLTAVTSRAEVCTGSLTAKVVLYHLTAPRRVQEIKCTWLLGAHPYVLAHSP